jgi:hypothetical protein
MSRICPGHHGAAAVGLHMREVDGRRIVRRVGIRCVATDYVKAVNLSVRQEASRRSGESALLKPTSGRVASGPNARHKRLRARSVLTSRMRHPASRTIVTKSYEAHGPRSLSPDLEGHKRYSHVEPFGVWITTIVVGASRVSCIYRGFTMRRMNDHQPVGGAGSGSSSSGLASNQTALHFRHQKYRLSRTTLSSCTDDERHSRQALVTRVVSSMGNQPTVPCPDFGQLRPGGSRETHTGCIGNEQVVGAPTIRSGDLSRCSGIGC